MPAKKTAPKRTAEAAPAEETPAKKLATTLKKHNVTQAAYKQVADVLEHPVAKEIFSEESREMFMVMLPHSICVPSDERQDFQLNAVDMLNQLMSQLFENMQGSLATENEKVANADAMKTDLEAKIQAADSALKAAQAVSGERQAELDTSSQNTGAAQADLTKAKEEQAAGEVSLTTARETKEALEVGCAGVFAKLKAGDWEEGQVEDLFKSVEPLLAKLQLDASLKTATRPTLLKKPDNRGMFDGKVVEELDKSFAKTIEDLNTTIAEGKPNSDAWAAAVTEAEAKLEAAEGVEKIASVALNHAKSSQKEAAAALKAAKSALADYKPEYKRITELRDFHQNQIQSFVDVNMAAFSTLKDKISAKKKKEIAAAEAEEKAAAEAAQKAVEAEAAAAAKAAEEKAAQEAAAAPSEEKDFHVQAAPDASEAATIAVETSAEEVAPKVEVTTNDPVAAEVGGA